MKGPNINYITSEIRDLKIQLTKSKSENSKLRGHLKNTKIELAKAKEEVAKAQHVVANMIDNQNSEHVVTFTDELTREERALLSGDPLPSFMRQ